MNVSRNSFPIRFGGTILPVLAGAAMAAVLLLRWDATFPLGPDSAGYVGIAYRLLHGGMLADPVGFVGHTPPRQAVHWPPGLPAILALLLWTGLPPLTAGQLLSASSMVALAALFAHRLQRQLDDPLAIAYVLVWFVLLPAFTFYGHSVLSEGLFALMAFGALLLLERALTAPGLRIWGVLGVVIASACAVRWLGVALTIPVGLSLILGGRRFGFRRWTLVRAAVCAAGGLPLGAGLVVWRLTTGDGPRTPFAGPILSQLMGTTEELARVVLFHLLAVGINAVVLLILVAKPAPSRRTVTPHVAPDSSARRNWDIHGSFVAAVLITLSLSGLRFAFDGVNLRTMMPTYPSLMLLLVVSVQRWQANWDYGWRTRAAVLTVGAAVLVAWHGHVLRRLLRTVDPAPQMLASMRAVARALPGKLHVPVVTEVPHMAVLRPDLLWRRLEYAPNGRNVSLEELLKLHPEHRGGWYVYRRDNGNAQTNRKTNALVTEVADFGMLRVGRLK